MSRYFLYVLSTYLIFHFFLLINQGVFLSKSPENLVIKNKNLRNFYKLLFLKMFQKDLSKLKSNKTVKNIMIWKSLHIEFLETVRFTQ